MGRKAAIYARVSTSNGQTPANQIARLREVAEKAGWEVVEEFIDRGISGAKGRDKRPAFDRLCKAATRREIDIVMAWSVDRLGGGPCKTSWPSWATYRPLGSTSTSIARASTPLRPGGRPSIN